MKAWTQVVFDDRPYSGLLPQESENRSQSQTIWCDWICAARTSKERNIRTLFPFHEPRRSGGSAERRHSNNSQYAALYRDAATVHGPDARSQLDVEAPQEAVQLRVADPRSGACLCEAQRFGGSMRDVPSGNSLPRGEGQGENAPNEFAPCAPAPAQPSGSGTALPACLPGRARCLSHYRVHGAGERFN
jgi:hypothetical protein